MSVHTRAVTPAEADLAFASLNKLYWDPTANYFRKEETAGKKADFWFGAQLWDTVMNEYDRTKSPTVKKQIDNLYDGFVKKYPDWTTNKFNDDIMWWVISCSRAYEITHDERYLKKSKQNFDSVYNNYLDSNMGGGLYWIKDRTSKNTCLNCPAVIAAVRLSVQLNDPSYLTKAINLYAWEKKTLSDGTGKVFDSINFDKVQQRNKVARFSLTYNQGTFIGAAFLLYQQTHDQTYLTDAIKAAEWTRANLCVGDRRVLRDENQGDGGAFKGIFVRYMKLLIDTGGRKEFLPWMVANANEAWSHRRLTDNIMGNDWTRTPEHPIQSQTAASAVDVVIEFSDDAPQK